MDEALEPAVLAKTVLAPGLIALAFAFLASWVPASWRRAFVALGVAIACATGSWLYITDHSWWPLDLTNRWHFILLAAGVTAVLAGPRWLQGYAGSAFAAFAVWSLVAPLSSRWEEFDRVLWFSGSALGILCLTGLASRSGPAQCAVPGALAMAGGLAAATSGLLGSLKLAQLGGMMATALSSVAALQLRRLDPAIARGASQVGAAAIGAHLITTYFMSDEVPLPIAGAAVGSVVLALLGAWIPAQAPSRVRVFVWPLVCAIPAAIAVYLAYELAQESASEYDYYDY